jgi:hypothetical protein
MLEQPSFDLRLGQAGTLRQAMTDAYTAVCAAHQVYENTLTRYVDSGKITTEGAKAISQEGHAYADVVGSYCNAVMTWLAYADTVLRKM